FGHYILPDVELGPVGEREDPNTLSLGLLRVVKVPQFRPLVLRIPAVARSAEGKYPFLGPALFLVAPGSAESRIETIMVERLLEPLRLPHVGMKRAVVERIDAAFLRFRIVPHQQ